MVQYLKHFLMFLKSLNISNYSIFYCLIFFFQFKKIPYIFNYVVFRLFLYFQFAWFCHICTRFNTFYLTIIIDFKKAHNLVFNTTHGFLMGSGIQLINQSYQSYQVFSSLLVLFFVFFDFIPIIYRYVICFKYLQIC